MTESDEILLAAMILLAETRARRFGQRVLCAKLGLDNLRRIERGLQALAHAGLLRSKRGATGGYWLGRPAGDITLAAILRAARGPRAEPPPPSPFRVVARQALDAAADEADAFLDRVTLADCLDDLKRPGPLPLHPEPVEGAGEGRGEGLEGDVACAS